MRDEPLIKRRDLSAPPSRLRQVVIKMFTGRAVVMNSKNEYLSISPETIFARQSGGNYPRAIKLTGRLVKREEC